MEMLLCLRLSVHSLGPLTMVKIHKEMSLSHSIQIPIMCLPILSEGPIPLGEPMSHVLNSTCFFLLTGIFDLIASDWMRKIASLLLCHEKIGTSTRKINLQNNAREVMKATSPSCWTASTSCCQISWIHHGVMSVRWTWRGKVEYTFS